MGRGMRERRWRIKRRMCGINLGYVPENAYVRVSERACASAYVCMRRRPGRRVASTRACVRACLYFLTLLVLLGRLRVQSGPHCGVKQNHVYD